MKKILLLVMFLCVAGLSGCGKMSMPEPYPGSGYPHTYPKN